MNAARWRGKLLAGLLFVGLGLAKLPVESRVSGQLRATGLVTPMVDLGVRENVGQMSFAAALGGLRSLIASITYMRAYLAFEDILWARVDSLFQLTNRLQPRNESYWDEASWHMAFNAASSYLYNQELKPTVRGQLYRQHVARGIEILEEGLRFNPNSSRLWGRLGDVYARRSREPVKAAEAYLKAAETGPAFFYRLAAYQLVQGPDRESWQRAYDLLKPVYDSGKRYPSVVDSLKTLEQRLNVPLPQRIVEEANNAAEVNRTGPVER